MDRIKKRMPINKSVTIKVSFAQHRKWNITPTYNNEQKKNQMKKVE